MTVPSPPSDDPRALFPWLPAQRIDPSREQLRAETLLGDIPLFSEVPPRRLCDIALVAHRETFRAGETIVRMGEPGSTLYVLHSGRVNVVREREDRAVILAGLGPGEFFGELSVLDGLPRTAQVAAEEPTRCLALASWDVERVLLENPSVALAVIRGLARRLRETLAHHQA